jgi:hypothetical protein
MYTIARLVHGPGLSRDPGLHRYVSLAPHQPITYACKKHQPKNERPLTLRLILDFEILPRFQVVK